MRGIGAGTAPARPLAAYAGTYDDCLYGPIHVRAAAGGLELQMGGGQTADLLPAGGEVFVVRWRDPFYRETRLARVTFEPAPDGTAARLAMDIGRDAIRAVRKVSSERLERATSRRRSKASSSPSRTASSLDGLLIEAVERSATVESTTPAVETGRRRRWVAGRGARRAVGGGERLQSSSSPSSLAPCNVPSAIYWVTPTELRIVAIAHHSRRPVYWRHRRSVHDLLCRATDHLPARSFL